jgi:hypothetical protein
VFLRRRARSAHVDDLDLLAYASGLRLDDAMARHIAGCTACRARQEQLAARAASLAAPSPATHPAWAAPRPRRGTRGWAWGAAAVSALALLLFWPRAIWTAAPPGPVALAVFLRGTADHLRPIRPVTGTVTVRFVRGVDWALLTASDLPVLPPQDVYEAWWIRGTRHVPAAVFRPDPTGHVSVWMPSRSGLHGVDAVGITIEPAPGTRVPTGRRAFFARLLS